MKRKVLKNVFYNIIASVISTGVSQLWVFPVLAKMFNETQYGNILFMIGIVNVIILTIGNALGDIRLTENEKYCKKGITGDFNRLLTIGSISSILATIIIMLAFKDILIDGNKLIVITLPIMSVFGTIYSYLAAIFRLKLLFKQNLKVNIILSIGNILGLVLAYITKNWTLPFLIGYLLAVMYQTKKTLFFKESLKKSVLYKKTSIKYTALSFSYLIKSSINYVDRFVITPILCANMLSIYTVASIFGKCASIAIQPIANVALGYYAQDNFKMTKKKFWVINLLTIFFGIIMYIIALMFSGTFIKILYPSYVCSATEYISIANISAILTTITAMIQPSILKCANVAWQIFIQLGYGVLVVVLSLIFIKRSGLYGFCYASIIANLCKILFMLLLGHLEIQKKEIEV